MKLSDLRLGFRTDAILHEFGAQLIERDDCLVVRTPGNPTFYWGNALLLPRAPADGDLQHWLRRFDEEITQQQPDSQHVAIGIDANHAGQPLPSWEAAGFVRRVTCTLTLPQGVPPTGWVALPLGHHFGLVELPAESAALMDLEATDAADFEPAAYRAYLQVQHQCYGRMAAQDRLRWFGIRDGAHLVASCGLMRSSAAPGAVGRFQRVITHPQWRRRGLCTALVQRVVAWAQSEWQIGPLVMGADPADVAIGIYRHVGFVDRETDWGLQRFAPSDRPAVA